MTVLCPAFLFASLIAPDSGWGLLSRPWLPVASGQVGDYAWSVKVKRPDGRAGSGTEGALRPCLLVGTKWQQSPYNYRRSRYRACTGETGHLESRDPPLIASGVQPSSGGRAGFTAVGIVVAPAVRRVRVRLDDGARTTIRPHRLTREQARLSRLGPIRYAAFAVRGSWCPERVVTLNAAGATLWESGPEELGCAAGVSSNAAILGPSSKL